MSSQRRCSLITALFLVFLCWNENAGAKVGLTNNQKDEINKVMGEIQRCTKADAMSFTLLDLPKYSRYEAFRGMDHRKQAVGAEHVFCIGEATQGFSAVLLAILIDANDTVSWDMPIERIIRRYTPLPDQYRTHHLTLKDIFAMRSGLSGMDIVPKAEPYDQATLINKLQYSPVVAGFREKYTHNEVLFALVQEATEALGGDTWFNLMRRHILIPLKMDNTVFNGPTMAGMRSDKNMVKGAVKYNERTHHLDQNNFDGLELVAPSSSMCTTARDMHQWFQFLLSRGMVENDKIIREDVLAMLYQGIQVRGADVDITNKVLKQPTVRASYQRTMNSLGFITGSYRGFEFVSQDGSLPGYQTLATILPETKVAVFVSMTGDERPRNILAKTLLNILGIDMMLVGNSWVENENVCSLLDDLEMKLNDKMAGNTVENAYSSLGKSARVLSDYDTTYKNFAFGDVVVRYNATGRGKLVLTYGKTSYKLEPTSVNDTFSMISNEPKRLWYSTNADWYQHHNRLFAVFGARPLSEEELDSEAERRGESVEELEHRDRVVNVTIAGFDSLSDPVFAINPRKPYVEGVRRDDCQNTAALMLSAAHSMVVFIIAVAISASGFLR